MPSINFDNIQEDFQRALHSVVSYYMQGGETRTVGGKSVSFIDCKIVYDIRTVENYTNKQPLIAFVGTRVGTVDKLKCTNAQKQLLVEDRISIDRTVIVKVNHSETNVSTGKREADRVWGQLYSVIATQRNRFRLDKEIFDVDMDPVPSELPDEESAILTGSFTCQLRVTHKPDSFLI